MGWKPCPIPIAIAIGKKLTLDTILIAATASSPYAPAVPFNNIVATLFNPCLSRLGKPVARILPMVGKSLATNFKEIRVCVFPLKNMESRMQKLINWAPAVAMPAPAIPSPNPNIRRASAKILITAPVIMPIVPSFALPS